MVTIVRPWGRMWKLFDNSRAWVKVIRVNPGARTSLQQHAHRAELHVGLDRWHWRHVKPYARHRMGPGLYLELAWGQGSWPRGVYENDIVRWEDDYGREGAPQYDTLR